MLSVKEVAALKNCSEQYIRAKCKSGEILAEKQLDEQNRPKYYIPLSALEPKLQREYRKSKRTGEAIQPSEPRLPKRLEEYNDQERSQIEFWTDLVSEWQEHRYHSADKVKSDQDFVVYARVAYSQQYRNTFGRELCLSTDILYRRWKGILKYGIPDYIYVDNGREFLTTDVGGLGHRKRKGKADSNPFTDFDPPPVFKRLGITMINALVRNARAKIIERRFRDVKDHLSRLFESYTGGNITPNLLNKQLAQQISRRVLCMSTSCVRVILVC